MVNSRGSGNPQRDLNHSMPAAKTVKLGDRLNDLITNLNLATAKLNAAVTALAAASGGSVPVLTAVTALQSPVAIATLTTVPNITGGDP
jgi:hypothetical protein